MSSLLKSKKKLSSKGSFLHPKSLIILKKNKNTAAQNLQVHHKDPLALLN